MSLEYGVREAGKPVRKDCGNPSNHVEEAAVLRVGRNGQIIGLKVNPHDFFE